MNKIFSLVLLLLPMGVFCQSKKANNLYNEGLKFYESKQYKSAIPLLQESNALEKKELNPSSPNYHRSEIALINCWNELAKESFSANDFAEAIRLQTLVVKSCKNTLGILHPDYFTVLTTLTEYQIQSGNKSDADDTFMEGLKYANSNQIDMAIVQFEISNTLEKKEYDSNSPFYHRSELALLQCWDIYVDFFGESENYEEAIKFQGFYVSGIKNLMGEMSINYVSALNVLARLNKSKGDLNESFRIGNKAVEIYKTIKDEENELYAEIIENIANYYSAIYNYNEAIRLETIVMDIRKKILGENNYDYAVSLIHLADNYSNIGNDTEAIKLGTTAMEIVKSILGEEHQDYAATLSKLAQYYDNIGKYAEAIRLGTMAMKIDKTIYGEEHPEYAMSLYYLANYYSDMGNDTEAIRLGTIAMVIRKNIFGEEHPEYATSINNLAIYYAQLCNYSEAIRLGTIAMEIRKKVLGIEHPEYATSINNLAIYYSLIGNYTEAIRLGTIAIEIKKKVLGIEHPEYATSINNLASFYAQLGNYSEAIRLETIAMEIRKKILGEEHLNYAESIQNLAYYNSLIGNYNEAIRLGTIGMEIKKRILGEEHTSYAMSINNLAIYNSYLGNYREAIRLGTIASEIRKKVNGEDHPDYATEISNLAIHYGKLGDYKETIRLATMALEIRKKALGEEHPDLANSIRILADFYFKDNNYDEAEKYYMQSFKCISSFILKNISSMTNKERTYYWNEYSNFFTNQLTIIAVVHPNEESTTLAYNGQIFAKGLLLNAELEMQNLIEQSNDSLLVNLYYKIKLDHSLLDNLYQIPPENRELDTDSLAKVIDKEEHLLVLSSKKLGDFTKNLSITWQDIQKKLTDNDIAIEFSNIKDTSDQNVYIALILKKGMSAPEVVELDFSETDAVDYSTPALYNIIWKPLENHLQDVQNVYFSPTGKFHNIGIEYLPDENGEIFAKKYNAYRLSSTRELALKHVANLNKKASVYGGIVYNYTQDDWQNVSEDAERAGITFLKGAKKESEEITQILCDSSFTITYGTDKAATEESFKKLSGSDIKILHIATHGFYEPENKENSFADMLSIGDKNSQEDLSLSRSGLFFAGANTALDPEQRKYIPEGVDDGILTAKEISRMDFKGLDLVVLSACQTGLGEVTSEGVFGLQRGFKKAGAQTIVMSLWNVSDKPTKELMTEFYRNLVAGKSKREAFISAQDKIRVKYIDPKMWAGFIMVDGIE